MPSTYTPNDKLTLQATGENPSTWGQIANTMIGLIDESLDGVTSLALSGTTATLTISDGATSNGRKRIIVLSGNPGSACTITISPNTVQKNYFIINGSSQSAVITQGSGGNITIPTGQSEIVYCDGAGATAKVAKAHALVTDQITEAVSAVNLWYTNARAQAAITGTAPVTVTSGVVALPAASGGASGYLSSTDWTAFNGKEPAITNGSVNLNKLAQSGAVGGQVVSWNGSAWVPATNPSAPVSSVFGRTGAVVAAGGDYSAGQITGLAAIATSGSASDITAGTLAAARYATMIGDGGLGGTKGAVPAPAAGDAAAGKFLKADGSWSLPGGGMKSVQRGSGSLSIAGGGTGNGSTTVTITAVTTSKSFVIVTGSSLSGSGDTNISVSGQLTNSTTVTITASVASVAAGGTVNFDWQVVEFN